MAKITWAINLQALKIGDLVADLALSNYAHIGTVYKIDKDGNSYIYWFELHEDEAMVTHWLEVICELSKWDIKDG